MGLRILDYVSYCYSNDDGVRIYRELRPLLAKCEKVSVSFEGVDAVTTSFVNSAFIELLQHYPFEYIKQYLTFTHTTKDINDLIKKSFRFEANRLNNEMTQAG